ncbi:MAG: hypothetical protein HYY30_13030 [Chloroflexi bacterium]|nr:hypothetical protein [Chloroflexota bacterium]
MRSWMARSISIVVVVGLMAGLAIGCTQAPEAETPEQFYRDKTINWIVASDAGSGTDTISRTIAPYLAKATGAKIKIENQSNESGVNYAYTEGKPDGLTMVALSTSSIITSDILKSPGIIYETEKLLFLADVNPSRKMMQISPKLPYRTLDEMRKAKGLKGGGTIAKGILALSSAVALDILGLDGQVITGYKGKKDLTLAVARGEVDFMVTNDDGANKDEADGYVVNFATIGDERSMVATNAPSVPDLGIKVPQEKRAAYQYVSTGGTAIALSPGVPSDKVEYLRKIFLKFNDDRDIQKDVIGVNEIWRPFVSGKEVQDQMIAIKSNKELANQLDAIFAKYSKVQ